MHWIDIEEIVKNLEEHYSDEDLEKLKNRDISEMVKSLNEFEDYETEASEEHLEEIHESWKELRKKAL